jgi:hypothetical protein
MTALGSRGEAGVDARPPVVFLADLILWPTCRERFETGGETAALATILREPGVCFARDS